MEGAGDDRIGHNHPAAPGRGLTGPNGRRAMGRVIAEQF